jgi:NADP-dependent 3-hydroxy acid dehydrogenase YdfG
MRKLTEKIIFITGASSGIGEACASDLAQEGHSVYGTYRSSKTPTKPELTNEHASMDSFTMIAMDVDDEISVEKGIQSILDVENRIDVVINSAGYALAGALEDTSVEEAKALFETNLWGIHRVCRAVLPSMREQHSGLIINISSIAGIVPLPFQSFYCASKFALEALTEALRMEVHDFGIDVVLVEPGDLATRFTANRHFTQGTQAESAYHSKFTKAREIIEYEEMHGYSPEYVARAVRKIMQHPSPRLRYRVGSPLQKSSTWLRKILPGDLFEWIIMKFYKVA